MVISPVFDPVISAFAPTVKVVLEVVPPAIENPVPNAVSVKPFIVLFVNDSVPVKVPKLRLSNEPSAFKNCDEVPPCLTIVPAVKLPPTTPAPLMLKLELACCVVLLAIYDPLPAGKSAASIALKAGAASAPVVGPAKKVFAAAVVVPVPPYVVDIT